MCHVQIHVADSCHLFDMLQADAAVLQHVKAMLEDKGIVKVFHDCRQDSAALLYQKGIKLQMVFDLQVMTVPYCIA